MWGERIYDLLPIALQNAAVSIKGWQFHRDRYLSRSFAETARLHFDRKHSSLLPPFHQRIAKGPARTTRWVKSGETDLQNIRVRFVEILG
jgi:hypothetical protein